MTLQISHRHPTTEAVGRELTTIVIIREVATTTTIQAQPPPFKRAEATTIDLEVSIMLEALARTANKPSTSTSTSIKTLQTLMAISVTSITSHMVETSSTVTTMEANPMRLDATIVTLIIARLLEVISAATRQGRVPALPLPTLNTSHTTGAIATSSSRSKNLSQVQPGLTTLTSSKIVGATRATRVTRHQATIIVRVSTTLEVEAHSIHRPTTTRGETILHLPAATAAHWAE